MTIIAFTIGLQQGGALLASTMAFGTLCISRLFHGFNCKSDKPVVFTKALFNNKALWGAFIVGMVLITAALMIPGLDHIFKVDTLDFRQLMTVYGLAFLNIPVIQFIKWIQMKLKK
jgi:Ca2+-transporting ATPase